MVAEVHKGEVYVIRDSGKWNLGSVREGSPVNPGASGFDEWFSAPNFFDNDPILSREGKAVQTQGESSMVTVDAAIEFIRKHSRNSQPFLAVVWFGSPHGPHEALEHDRALYVGQSDKLQHFYGEITAMDRAFGKLREELRSFGIHENTLFWYCSDNGGLPNIGSTGGRGNKGQIYEGGLRVPALIEWPGHITNSRVTGVPCNTTDIYPTLLEIAGVRTAYQPPLDGISLVSLIDGTMKDRQKPMGFWDYPAKGKSVPGNKWMTELLDAQKAGNPVGDTGRLLMDAGEITETLPSDSYPGHSAWLDWPWKLHRIQGDTGTVIMELYNLSDDPGEKEDRAVTDSDRVNLMKSELENWLKSVVGSHNGNDYN